MGETQDSRNTKTQDIVFPNRMYKSRIFTMIFQDKEKLLELYNAISGKHYTDPELLEINTLENAIYMNMQNDLSFIIDARLSLYEHQSTVNPNLPLRFLWYISKLYMEITRKKNIYGTEKVEIPEPQFVVFYNGAQKQPEKMTQYLSDSFEQKTDDPELELKCKVYNINYGKNRAIMEKCRWLDEWFPSAGKYRGEQQDTADGY